MQPQQQLRNALYYLNQNIMGMRGRARGTGPKDRGCRTGVGADVCQRGRGKRETPKAAGSDQPCKCCGGKWHTKAAKGAGVSNANSHGRLGWLTEQVHRRDIDPDRVGADRDFSGRGHPKSSTSQHMACPALQRAMANWGAISQSTGGPKQQTPPKRACFRSTTDRLPCLHRFPHHHARLRKGTPIPGVQRGFVLVVRIVVVLRHEHRLSESRPNEQ